MSTRLSRQKFELAPNVRFIHWDRKYGCFMCCLPFSFCHFPSLQDGETSIDSRDVTDQESEEEPASSISSTVPSPALSQRWVSCIQERGSGL